MLANQWKYPGCKDGNATLNDDILWYMFLRKNYISIHTDSMPGVLFTEG